MHNFTSRRVGGVHAPSLNVWSICLRGWAMRVGEAPGDGMVISSCSCGAGRKWSLLETREGLLAEAFHTCTSYWQTKEYYLTW